MLGAGGLRIAGGIGFDSSARITVAPKGSFLESVRWNAEAELRHRNETIWASAK